MFKKLLYCLILGIILLKSSVFGQNTTLSNQSKISIITCGSGNELYSIYGHTAIRVQDTKNNLDVVFNYGTFDFRTENFYMKFVKGDLQYFVSASSFADFMSEYIFENREVSEQNLILTTEQKQKIYDELVTSLFSDDKFYTYKFIDKNCTTMVLDKVNSLYGSALVKKNTTSNCSYRAVLYPYLKNHFFENLGINIMFGYKTDQLATKLFLPIELLESLKTTKIKKQHITEPVTILNPKSKNSTSFVWWNSIYAFCLVLLLLNVFKKKVIIIAYFFLFGSLGLFLSWVGFYSFHHEIAQNYNVLLFNPSLLVLLFMLALKKQKVVLNLIYLNWICLAIYTVFLCNKPDFLMMLPLIITSSLFLKKLLPSEK